MCITYQQYMVQNDAKNEKSLMFAFILFFNCHFSLTKQNVLSILYCCFYITLQIDKLVFVHIHTALSCTIITSYIPMNVSSNELYTALCFAPSVLLTTFLIWYQKSPSFVLIIDVGQLVLQYSIK